MFQRYALSSLCPYLCSSDDRGRRRDRARQARGGLPRGFVFGMHHVLDDKAVKLYANKYGKYMGLLARL